MITSKSKNKYLWFPIAKVFVAFVLIYIVFNLVVEDIVYKSLVFAMSLGFIYMCLFYILPIALLYYSHKKSSKGKSYVIRNGSWEISSNGNVFTWNDVKSVEKYLTISKYNERFDWSLWGHYYYLVFNTHAGSKITLPCLIINDPLNLDSVEVIKKKKIFPIPKKDVIVQPDIAISSHHN